MASHRENITVQDSIAPKLLGGKISEDSPLVDLLCSKCRLPVTDARQTIDCGCRLCGHCYTVLDDSGERHFKCGKCGNGFDIIETFRDKAVENELKRRSFPCYNPKCPWVGGNTSYRDHISSCQFSLSPCPNPGCDVYTARRDMETHSKSCQYKLIKCKLCGEHIPAKKTQQHELKDCKEHIVNCPNDCGDKLPRKMIAEHILKECRKQRKQCLYSKHGCTFKGNRDELARHSREDYVRHLEMLERVVSKSNSTSTHSTLTLETQQKTDQKISNLHTEFTTLKNEMTRRLNPLNDGMIRMEATIQEFQDSFQELALLVQTLQATSYNGQFIWKIPEVERRRDEAVRGRTISLYSAPFYTSRFGYKLCLRLYMDGDGSGKGTHLSFFLTLMKGEYDALLPWPFNQTVTLMLLDQSGNKKHIIQSFKPEPSSSSFWRPQSDMNVASGCPKFALLSVVKDSNFVKDDTIFFKASIDTAGLT